MIRVIKVCIVAGLRVQSDFDCGWVNEGPAIVKRTTMWMTTRFTS